MDLTAARWSSLDQAERRSVAEQLLRQLPQGFALAGVEGRIAQFGRAGSTFSFVPGGPARLGFNVDRWRPNQDALNSWRITADKYELPELSEYVAQVTLRPREVELDAMLVEARSTDAGWEPLALDDPRVIEAMASLGPSRGLPKHTLVSGDNQLELRYVQDCLVGARQARNLTHADLAGEIQREGFRLPSCDEWEYACGACASTLFHWGDHVPCDRYPPDLSAEENKWRRKWAMSGGTLQPPPGGFVSDWERHRRPNAFGLYIASDPYQHELVDEADTTRGGDGGTSICDGAGFFMGWLPLATAWFDPAFCQRNAAEPIPVGYTVMRRVLPLT